MDAAGKIPIDYARFLKKESIRDVSTTTLLMAPFVQQIMTEDRVEKAERPRNPEWY